MSFIITMYVREGIVMASDSRLSLDNKEPQGDKTVIHVAVGQSDSNYKTFLAPGDIGISTYGAADIGGTPIAGYIESFMHERLTASGTTLEQAALGLLEYFRTFDPAPATQFHVAGYMQGEGQKIQQVWHVDVARSTTRQLNPPGKQGVSWGGEADILTRLIQSVAVLGPDGSISERLPYFQVPWQFFNLQDAIDFCIFAVRSTIEAIRFQPRPKTVGGPIDVLVIKLDGAFWVQKKQLHG
jgi:hypothetical protein